MIRQKTYVLAKSILERKDALFGSNDNVVKPQILKEKEDAWEAVRLEMIDHGFTQFERKSWRDVRNHDWQYLRRSAVAKHEHNQKPGVETIPYNDVDKIVFDIMGNEEAASSSNNEFVNGAIAASYNWLKFEDQQQQQNSSFDGFDSSFFQQIAPSTTFNFTGSNTSFDVEQQQINSILNSALVASATMLGRKMSYESCSPAESPQGGQQKQQMRPNPQQQQQQQNNEVETMAQKEDEQANRPAFPNPKTGLLQSIIAASSLPNNHHPQSSPNSDQARPFVSSSGVITSSTSAAPSRKRQHSSSSGSRCIGDEIQEAKLKHIQLQVRREEVMLQQEKAKLLQEEAKVRQETAKAELLERQLRGGVAGN